jgi:hypothetical protein
MAVTIQNLEVNVDVEGEGDEAVFARLFTKYINQWSRHAEEQRERERRSASERSLGDRRTEDVD